MRYLSNYVIKILLNFVTEFHVLRHESYFSCILFPKSKTTAVETKNSNC